MSGAAALRPRNRSYWQRSSCACLDKVDYLVGREGELRALARDLDDDADFEEVARKLLAMPVGAVCAVEAFGCRIRSKNLLERVSLLTNNLAKVAALEAAGIVVKREKLIVDHPGEHTSRYLEAKERHGHAILTAGSFA
ncbi:MULTISPECIES: hypothetical protein [unclassified Amycolatopsis]|uniref:hypothetical protein n=1 Tax=unclassified Amycolatopsis TaxID=2618356 RepID=UPI001C6A365E|nr:hypothetical protein [Amycolatopsis sp. DSM 110486]QYN25434.1 hypothetical protein K1T34_25225 [Amycolatopsis sp. DSM 110486]